VRIAECGLNEKRMDEMTDCDLKEERMGETADGRFEYRMMKPIILHSYIPQSAIRNPQS
jgi:hypothetical protein